MNLDLSFSVDKNLDTKLNIKIRCPERVICYRRLILPAGYAQKLLVSPRVY